MNLVWKKLITMDGKIDKEIPLTPKEIESLNEEYNKGTLPMHVWHEGMTEKDMPSMDGTCEVLLMISATDDVEAEMISKFISDPPQSERWKGMSLFKPARKHINTVAGRVEFLDAVDIVCAECHYGDDEVCKDCPVRKTVDKIQEVPCDEEN